METGHRFRPRFSKEGGTTSLMKPIRGEDSGEASVIQMLHAPTLFLTVITRKPVSVHDIFFFLPSILTSSICSKHLSARLVVFSYCEAWDFLLRSCYGLLHCGLPDFLHRDQRTSWPPCPRLRCSSVRNLDSEAEVFYLAFSTSRKISDLGMSENCPKMSEVRVLLCYLINLVVYVK